MQAHAQPRHAQAWLPAIIAMATLTMFHGAADAQARERQGKEVVDAVCSGCHATGKDSAPAIGDRAAWTPRLARGLDALVASAIHGHGSMPSRGGLSDLTDKEIRGAIVYMFNYGVPATVPAPTPVSTDPRHRIVSGTDVYLGMMRAESVTGIAKAGAPSGKGYYHVNISLADNKSQAPVADAKVKVQVSDGMSTESKTLGLIAANNAVSYGNYFRFSSGSAYNITAEIQRPGVAGPIEAKFEFRAP